MTFLLNSDMSTITQTISTQNTTQANFDLINHNYALPLHCFAGKRVNMVYYRGVQTAARVGKLCGPRMVAVFKWTAARERFASFLKCHKIKLMSQIKGLKHNTVVQIKNIIG